MFTFSFFFLADRQIALLFALTFFFKADPGMFYMLIRYISAVAGDLTAVFQLFSYSSLELREILFV